MISRQDLLSNLQCFMIISEGHFILVHSMVCSGDVVISSRQCDRVRRERFLLSLECLLQISDTLRWIVLKTPIDRADMTVAFADIGVVIADEFGSGLQGFFEVFETFIGQFAVETRQTVSHLRISKRTPRLVEQSLIELPCLFRLSHLDEDPTQGVDIGVIADGLLHVSEGFLQLEIVFSCQGDGCHPHLSFRVLAHAFDAKQCAEHDQHFVFIRVETLLTNIGKCDGSLLRIDSDFEEDTVSVLVRRDHTNVVTRRRSIAARREKRVHRQKLTSATLYQLQFTTSNGLATIDLERLSISVIPDELLVFALQLLFHIANEETKNEEHVEVLHAQGFVQHAEETRFSRIPPDGILAFVVLLELVDDCRLLVIASVVSPANLDEFLSIGAFVMHAKQHFDEQLKPHEHGISRLQRFRSTVDHRDHPAVSSLHSNVIFGEVGDEFVTTGEHSIALPKAKKRNDWERGALPLVTL